MNSKPSLRDFRTSGLVLESLCVHDLLVYTRASSDVADEPLCYYQGGTGLKVDVTIEWASGSWAGIEIELKQDKLDQATANLLRLKQKLVGNPLAQAREPAFSVVIVGLREYAYQRPGGVYVIPSNALIP